MSAKVTGGPTHWRANLDELALGVGRLQDATEHSMRLAGEATVAGGLLAGVTIMTPQGPMIGANTVAISTGLLTMQAEVAALRAGVDFAVNSYLETEQQISRAVDAAFTPLALAISIVGVTTDVNVPNDVYEIAIRGTTSAAWAPVESAFTTLDGVLPGSKYVAGNTIGWMAGFNDNLWDVAPTQRTIGTLAHALGYLGLSQLAPYDTTNITQEPGADGWQSREALGADGSLKSMSLLQDYGYDHDTITVAKIEQPQGSDVYAVIYPGTTPVGDGDGALGALQDNAAFGVTGFVESAGADSPHVEATTLQILEQAGVPAGATVIPMGYSQGGAHAMNVGLGQQMKSKYNVTDVLTVAAYTGHRRTDDLETNLVHVEHEHDKVSALTGASNEARLNRTTIEVQGYPDEDIDAGIFGAEHNLGLIDGQLADALHDPAVQHATEIPLGKLEQKMGGPVAVQQFHLDRQQAPPTRHPTQPVHQAEPDLGAPRKIIGVRPLDQWLTATIPRP